jgi:2-polyprenyl-3-methyl-5-hydroxy-6-metoxy-1,4-benzoquinol methylase
MNELRLKHLEWFSRSSGVRFGGKAVLDVGCGGGELARIAADQGARGYVGCDISESALERSRQLNPQANFIQHDARTPFPETLQRLDVVALFDVLEHVVCPEEVHQVMRNVLERLAPDGVIIGRTCNADSPFVALHRYNDETHKFAFRTTLLASIFAQHGLAIRFVDEDKRAVTGNQKLMHPLKLVVVFVTKKLVRMLTGEHIESLHPSIYFVASRTRVPPHQ